MKREPRSALYRIEAYGLANEWNLWALAEGALTDLCYACGGSRFEVRRPCVCSAHYRPVWACEERCTLAEGCPHCRARCHVCHGRGMAPAPLYAEDFGDAQSLAIARRLFDVDVDMTHRRIDMEARPL